MATSLKTADGAQRDPWNGTLVASFDVMGMAIGSVFGVVNVRIGEEVYNHSGVKLSKNNQGQPIITLQGFLEEGF